MNSLTHRSLELATAFVARINEHDLVGLSDLMTDDHMFIDALKNCIAGRAAMQSAWKQYFVMIPDYWIKVDRTFHDERVVALFGVAGGTYAGGVSGGRPGRWEAPAAWLAETRGHQVAKWRVYADNLPLRLLMGGEGPGAP